MSHKDVLDMPVTAFWLYSRNIDRLVAEQELRQVRMNNVLQSGSPESFKQYQEGLFVQLDSPVVSIQEAPEEGALNRLESLLG